MQHIQIFSILILLYCYQKMTTSANTTTCPCSWCKNWIGRGVMAYHTKRDNFEEKIKEISSRIGHANNLPIGPKLLIFSFLEHNSKDIQTYCLDCVTFDVKFSQSGRIIKAPIRLSEESFVKGSGENNCDQYDRSYDDGSFYDIEKEDCHDLDNFIVSDEEIISDDDTSTSEDSEEDWDDGDSSEEEWSGDESD